MFKLHFYRNSILNSAICIMHISVDVSSLLILGNFLIYFQFSFSLKKKSYKVNVKKKNFLIGTLTLFKLHFLLKMY